MQSKTRVGLSSSARRRPSRNSGHSQSQARRLAEEQVTQIPQRSKFDKPFGVQRDCLPRRTWDFFDNTKLTRGATEESLHLICAALNAVDINHRRRESKIWESQGVAGIRRPRTTRRPRACHVRPDTPLTARHSESWNVMPDDWCCERR